MMNNGIQFSRQVCDVDPTFMVVRIRVPRMGHADQSFGAHEGVMAQIKASKYILASASGMLRALGAPNLSAQITAIWERYLATDGELPPSDQLN